MKAKTELFLWMLMWNVDTAMRPTWSNLQGSFEGWAWRQGLLGRIGALEKRAYLERLGRVKDDKRIVRLTRSGVLRAMGGRDPVEQWDRHWDGLWRMILFDIEESKRKLRAQLRRELLAGHFGCLQGSVWISPDPIDEVGEVAGTCRMDAASLVLVEGRCRGGETNSELVARAWDFRSINQRYELHLDHLRKIPKRSEGVALREWIQIENELWLDAVRFDPLLPRALLPKDYRGEASWEKRLQVIAKLRSAIFPHAASS